MGTEIDTGITGEGIQTHTPDSGWTCGTAHVWMVHESTLQEFGVDQNDWRKVFVCEHQIEID